MKKLTRALKKRKLLVFLDLEGTQFSHEMIALGAVKCLIKADGRIKKTLKGYRTYVKNHHKIGHYVINLTGITQDKLDQEGISYKQCLEDFKKYVGHDFENALFVTFGSHDLRILNQSVLNNPDCDGKIVHQIIKNHLDFSMIISEFIRDNKNNSLSLHNYLELFTIKEEGVAHDPLYDALNLSKLYQAFLTKKDIVLEQYLLVLKNDNRLPDPIKKCIARLVTGENVTSEEFKEYARNYLKND